MNITLAHPKQTKQTFIRLTTPPPSAKKDQKGIHQKQCATIFFVDCLNGDPTQHSDKSEELEIHQLHKSSPDKQRKGKLTLSVNQKNTQQFQTPRREERKEEGLEKPIEQVCWGIKETAESGSNTKLAFSSEIFAQLRKKCEQQSCEDKQTQTRNSIEQCQNSSNGKLSPANTQSNIKKESEIINSYYRPPLQTKAIQHASQPIIFAIDEKQSIIEKSQASQKELEEFAEPINWKERLKNRRWIGEYAQTIKSFNPSEPSQIESVVIERGANRFQEEKMVTPLNRGSIKECPGEEFMLKRAYGSVGNELHKAHLDRLFDQCIDQIEEVLLDSEI